MKPIKTFITTIAIMTLGLSTVYAEEPEYLPYDEFISKVESGSIVSVTLDRHSRITGAYTIDGSKRQFNTYGDTGSANDVLLNRLLKDKGVRIDLKLEENRHPLWGGGIFTTLLFLVPIIIPIVTLVLVLRIHTRLQDIPNA
jgi:ATP-dependent Zn protease